MRKFLLIYTILATLLIYFGGRYAYSENERLRQNIVAAREHIHTYRTAADKAAASVQVLRLRCGEYEEMHRKDVARIEAMGIKLRRVEAAATSATSMQMTLRTPLRDTLLLRDTVVLRDTLRLRDTVRLFRWQDAWVTIDGKICRDSVECRVQSVDTLYQTVHRVPRRFLFFRYGTKALRQEIVSQNPHTKIVYTEYIEIERRCRRR